MKSAKNILLAFAADLFSRLFSRKRRGAAKDIIRGDFSQSAQKTGVSITDEVRDAFRHTWLRWRRRR